MPAPLEQLAPPAPHARAGWAGGWLAGGALVVLCLAVYLPGLWTLPPVDRDEPRFAQASRQMLRSGTLEGWVVPRVQDAPRLNKPPLVYWLQASSAAVFGDEATPPPRPREGGLAAGRIWVFRLPSVLAAILAALATWRLGARMFDPRAGLLAGALLGCCVIVAWDAHQARADQLLLAATTLTMAALWSIWRARDRPDAGSPARAALFWLFLALGVMTKGPITPMVAGLAAFALCAVSRRWGWLRGLRPLLGMVVVGAVVAPWVFLVGRSVGWSEYAGIVWDETVGRTIVAKESHWGPPGYYLVLLPVLFWPGSMLTAVALSRALRRGLRRPADEHDASGGWLRRAAGWIASLRAGRDAELFCLAWILPSWLVFELVGTKLPHYTMPLYPPIALLTARAVLAADAGSIADLRKRSVRFGLWLWVGIGACLGVVAPAALAAVAGLERSVGVLVVAAGAVLAAAAMLVCAAMALRRDRYVRAQAFGIAAAVVGIPGVVAGVLPHLRSLWLSSRLVAIIRAHDPGGDRPLATAGYGEDSLVFLTHGRIDRIGRDRLAAWLSEHPGGLAVAPADIAGARVGAISVGTVDGFNYSNGEWARLQVLESAGRPPGQGAHADP